MATRALAVEHRTPRLEPAATFPGMRVLAWNHDVLYASRGYRLLSARLSEDEIRWREVAACRPALWRRFTSRSRIASRLVRDGFHALAVSEGNLIAAVPGAIATLPAGCGEFQISHRVKRGTRPLHFAVLPNGGVRWGEYFDNSARDEVHIYASADRGLTWETAYTFRKHSIRHVHNLLYDRWLSCVWIFTGDYGRECRILRASPDFRTVDEALCGGQQARAVAAVVTRDGLYFASDTPLEQNHIYFLESSGAVRKVAPIPSSSIYACRNRRGIFFSTMVEPSQVNLTRNAALFGSESGADWHTLTAWRKDLWPMKFFQYGNVVLPDGENSTEWLAASAIAVEDADLKTFIWKTTLTAPARDRSGSGSRHAQFAML